MSQLPTPTSPTSAPVALQLPVLPLEKDNLVTWELALTSYALNHGFDHFYRSHIDPPSNNEALQRHIALLTNARQLINFTLNPSQRRAFGDQFFSLEPHIMLQQIREKYTVTPSPEQHHILHTQALELTLTDVETIEDYVQRHMELRNRMLRYQYPNIDHESTTCHYIIRGLQNHPFYGPLSLPLLIHQFTKIRDLELRLESIPRPAPTSDHNISGRSGQHDVWCEWHKRYGNHSTADCNAMKRAQSGQTRPPRRTTRQSTPSQTASQPRRSQSKKETKRRALHVEQTYAEDSGPASESGSEDEHKNTKVNATEPAFISYVIDSACTPSYSTNRLSPMSSTNTTVTLPDGTQKPIAAHANAYATTQSGNTMSLGQLCYTPSFKRHLLSVGSLTTANGCHVTFTPTGGYITNRTRPPKHDIIATFKKRDGLYHIPLQVNTNQQSAHIITPFRKSKPIRTRPPPPPKKPLPPVVPASTPPDESGTSAVSPPPTPFTPAITALRRRPPPPRNKAIHRLHYPQHLPSVPPRVKQQYDAAFDWHIRLNHIDQAKLRTMAKSSQDYGLPATLAEHTSSLNCHGCAVGHMRRKPHKLTTSLPPAGHTVVTDIGGPLPKTLEGYQYYITFTELKTRMTIALLLQLKSEAESTIIAVVTQIERHFGCPVARFRCDNANEFLTQKLLKIFGARATAVDPTIPHSPQENSVAERLNQTLLSRVRSTLATAQLPFPQYWGTCLLDCVSKGNSTHHNTINDVPRRLWNSHASLHSPFPERTLNLNQFRAYGEYALIPTLQDIKSKSTPRAIMVRYLCSHAPNRYKVLDVRTGRIITTRITDYHPYNPNYDPQTRYYHPIPPSQTTTPRINAHHALPKQALQASRLSPHTDVPNTAKSCSKIPTAISTLEPQHHANTAFPTTNNSTSRASALKPPRGLAAARKHRDAQSWHQAYKKEWQAHKSFGTFRQIPKSALPHGARIYKLVIAFAYKYDAAGRITGHKARFAFPGNRLQAGEHYDDTKIAAYAADRDAVRLLLSLAVHQNLDVSHIDLKNAFLHEEYKGNQPLFVQPIHSFEGEGSTSTVLQVMKNLYGTPQATKVYLDGVQLLLTTHGYHSLKSDVNIFIRRSGQHVLMIALTIDDFLVTYSNPSMYKHLIDLLKSKYRVKDLGPVSNIIGWSVQYDRSNQTMHLSQPRLVQEFISFLRMQDSRPCPTPYSPGIALQAATSPDEVNISLQPHYRRALGVLRYIVDSTRPNLAYIAGILARHTNNPTQRHWLALKHVARYLSHTPHLGLLFTSGHNKLICQSDADHAGCPDTRQSTSGSLIYHGPNLISWSSQRIKSVVTNTFEAEFISASNTAKHALWIFRMLSELSRYKPTVPLLQMDNQGALDLSHAAGPTKRAKYIDLRVYHLQDLVHSNYIHTTHLHTDILQADALTKSLSLDKFLRHRAYLSLSDPQHITPTAVESLHASGV